MADDFASVGAALWASLGLPKPTPGRDGSLVLMVDGEGVTLRPSPDGQHIVIAVECGRLSSDPVTRDRQLRAVMRNNLGLLVASPASLRLVGPPTTAVAVVATSCRCRMTRLSELVKTIEDTLNVVKVQRIAMDDSEGHSPPRPQSADLGSDETLIFRL